MKFFSHWSLGCWMTFIILGWPVVNQVMRTLSSSEPDPSELLTSLSHLTILDVSFFLIFISGNSSEYNFSHL